MRKRNWFLSIFLMLVLFVPAGFTQDNNVPGTADSATNIQQEGRQQVLDELNQRRARVRELINAGKFEDAEKGIADLFNLITDVPDLYDQLKSDITQNEMADLSKAMQASNQNNGQTPGTQDSAQQPGDDNSGTRISPPNPGRDVLARVKELRAKAQKLIRQRKFEQAEKVIETCKKVMTDVPNRYKQLYASLHRNEVVALESAQGHYQRAANAVRTAMKYNTLKSDMQLLLKTQEKVSQQREWFNIRENYERSLTKLLDARMPLLKEKLEILRQMDTSKVLPDEDLKKLQTQLRQINARLAAVNKNITETHRKFAVQREKYQGKLGIVLKKEQQAKLRPLVMERQAKQLRSYRMFKEMQKHLTNIAEHNEITWDGLKENFTEFGKLQDEIWDLRKQLLVLSRKAPLEEKEYALAKRIRAKLERAMKKAEELMGKIEKAFIDTKVFSKLTLKEKLEFVKLFREVWSKDREFDNLKPSLEDIYKKVFEQIIVIDDPKPIPLPEPKPQPVNQISGEGRVINERDNEGDHWFIMFDGRMLYPVNLPTRYRINDLEVKFSGEVVELIEPNSQGGIDTTSPNYRWWQKYPRLQLTSISAPQLPDEPYERGTQQATPTQVIEENIDNQDQPANLMNSF